MCLDEMEACKILFIVTANIKKALLLLARCYINNIKLQMPVSHVYLQRPNCEQLSNVMLSK